MVSNAHENLAFFFDRNFIDPFLEKVEWSDQNYTENSFTNLLLS
jgi:hypothetical protein